MPSAVAAKQPWRMLRPASTGQKTQSTNLMSKFHFSELRRDAPPGRFQFQRALCATLFVQAYPSTTRCNTTCATLPSRLEFYQTAVQTDQIHTKINFQNALELPPLPLYKGGHQNRGFYAL
jgi:hypothetical protein